MFVHWVFFFVVLCFLLCCVFCLGCVSLIMLLFVYCGTCCVYCVMCSLKHLTVHVAIPHFGGVFIYNRHIHEYAHVPMHFVSHHYLYDSQYRHYIQTPPTNNQLYTQPLYTQPLYTQWFPQHNGPQHHCIAWQRGACVAWVMNSDGWY